MRTYITTVKLKDAEKSDYDRLDNEMKKVFFARTKQGKAPGTEHPAEVREYNYQGSNSLQEVVAATYQAARKIGKEYSFTVMKEKRIY